MRTSCCAAKVIDRSAGDEGGSFFEIQTPILTASSPEGGAIIWCLATASRKFYVTPQAAAIQAVDRDRGLTAISRSRPVSATRMRADRSPGEFRLDRRMSFVTQQDVLTRSSR
jgi:aspartyl-tRNA synthetase